MAREDRKPSSERLREYRDSARESLEQQLFSPAPIYDDLERVKLADSLARFVELRGTTTTGRGVCWPARTRAIARRN